jgi:hypothetical protein
MPLLGPVAEKLGIDLVWFGVLLAVNMQTSFMHPPFGFALFYLRSVAPHSEYIDRLTQKKIARSPPNRSTGARCPSSSFRSSWSACSSPSPAWSARRTRQPRSIQNSIQLEAPPVPTLEQAADEKDEAEQSAADKDKADGKEEEEKEEEADDPAKALEQSLKPGKK